jgi:hypothetical protein
MGTNAIDFRLNKSFNLLSGLKPDVPTSAGD